MKYIGVLNVHRLDAYGNGLLFRTHVLHVCVYVLRCVGSCAMFFVLLCNCCGYRPAGPREEPWRGAFPVQFRNAQDAERFARFRVCLLVLHVSVRWQVAIFEVEPFCLPDAADPPLLSWICGHTCGS